MSVILTPESQAWLRSTNVGVQLPPAVETAAERLAQLEAELAELGPPLEVSRATQLTAAGMTLAEAQAEVTRMKAARASQDELRRMGADACHSGRFILNRAVAEHREELVVQLRPLMDALIDKARPLAETLAPFAPGYAPGDVVRRGDAKVLKAWQEAEALEKEFGVLMAAWRASLKEQAKSQSFDLREVPQEHLFWAHPEHVANEALNGTKLNRYGHHVPIQATVLAVAAEPTAAEFQLATVAEAVAVYTRESLTPRTREKAQRLGVRFV